MLSLSVQTINDHPVHSVQGDLLLVIKFFINKASFLIITPCVNQL
jgi:hypothetical protein